MSDDIPKGYISDGAPTPVPGLPSVADEINTNLREVFQSEAARAALTPTLVNRFLLLNVADQTRDDVVIAFGSAAFRGSRPDDPNGEVLAACNIAVAIPPDVARQLVVELAKSLGIQVQIAMGRKKADV